MKKIELTKGLFALVDDDLFPFLNRFCWYVSHTDRTVTPYAMTWFYGKGLQMHRLIMKTPKGYFVDHINGNGLDNRLSNLRICTKTENNRYSKKRVTNKSGFKGVHFRADGRRCQWRAQLQISKTKRINKSFKTAIEAAHQYNKWAIEHHGQYALLNKLDQPEEGGTV